jgi:hypothetical protein
MPGLVNSHHHVGLTPFQLESPDYAPPAASPRAAPAVPAARPQPPVLSGRGGASRRPAGAGQPLARGVRADPRRGQQRTGWQQGGRGWVDAVGGKGRLIFLSPRSVGPPNMDEEADQDESDQEELVK